MATCRSCGAEILWAESESTGKWVPLDATPTARGNLVLISGKVRPYGEADQRLHRDRYVSHFSTCADADDWRKDR